MIKQMFWLENFESFFVEGKHAKRFLNGMTTTNINLDRKFIQTCWLSTKGNLRALLEIHFFEDKLLLFVLEGNIKEIKDFLEDMIFPADQVSLSNNFFIFRIQEIQDNKSWRMFEPKILIEKDPKNYCKENKINLIEKSMLEQWKIEQAIPRFDYEIDGNNNPLELGLYDLIDFDKGCYLGQEAMARLNKISSLKQEIRLWSVSITNKNFDLKDKKIYFDEDNLKIVGYITGTNFLNTDKLIGLSIIKKNFLTEKKPFFNKELGELKIQKSVGSVFI